jgi:hypothetical protein
MNFIALTRTEIKERGEDSFILYTLRVLGY